MRFVAAIGTGAGFLIGILVHEVVTHRAAVAMGDRTPKLYGRTAVSVKAHADPLGSYIIPAVFVISGFVLLAPLFPPFGWGKRHSIVLRNVRNQPSGAILVALSGPIATGVLAVVAGVIARGAPLGSAVQLFFVMLAAVLAGLTIFELLPIPGRDGGRVLARFLSPRAAMKMEELEEYDVLFVIVLYTLLLRLTAPIIQAGCRFLTGIGC